MSSTAVSEQCGWQFPAVSSEQHLGEGVGCGRAHREVRQWGSKPEQTQDGRRGWLSKGGAFTGHRAVGRSRHAVDHRGKNGGARRHQDRPGGSPGARVPQDIDSEVVSGQATAIPAPPTGFPSGQRKQKAGAVYEPADGVAVPSGPWCHRHQGPSTRSTERCDDGRRHRQPSRRRSPPPPTPWVGPWGRSARSAADVSWVGTRAPRRPRLSRRSGCPVQRAGRGKARSPAVAAEPVASRDACR